MVEIKERIELLIVQKIISSFSEEEQKIIYECRGVLAAIVAGYEGYGHIALDLLGAELHAELKSKT